MSLRNKQVIVFGATGFVGKHLCNKLRNLGVDVDTPCIDVSNYDAVFGSIMSHDIVFNCAAVADIAQCFNDPLLAYRVNTLGAVNILDVCRCLKIPRVVLSSSNIVLGADTPYKATFIANEQAGLCFSSNYNMSVISLRFANIYGGFRKNPTVIQNFAEQAKRGVIKIMGDGNQLRDFIHINDVVDSMIAAAESNYSGILDICTGVMTSINTVAEMFECKIEHIDRKIGDVSHIFQDPEPAKMIIGWEYKIPLKEGIKDVYRPI